MNRIIRALFALATVCEASAALGLEVRTAESDGGMVTVGRGERVDDSLIALGNSVVVDGTVDGDLVAFARQVVVRGTVTGDLMTAAETVSIEGTVEGNVLAAGREIEALEGHLARNLYGFGERVVIGRDARLGANATLFGESVRVGGAVGRDLLSFARELELTGQVTRNATFYGQEARITPGARIGGDLTSHVPNEANVTIGDGAEIGGAVATERYQTREHRSRYLRPSFYGFWIVRFAAAFLVGMLLFTLVPGLATAPFGDAAEMLVSTAIGFAAIIGVPIAVVIVAITVIGLPLGIIGLLAWVAALYLAKIVVAGHVGERLMVRPGASQRALALAVGLAIVLIAVSLPWIGGLLNIVATALGFGMLLRYLWNRWHRDSAAVAAG